MKNALDFFAPRNLSNFFDDWFNDFNNPIYGLSKKFTNSPKVNVKETDKAYEIEIANPGFTADETKVEVMDHVIYVSMKSETEDKDENDNDKYHVRQWSKAAYEESWNIPTNVNEEEISAKNKHGVLTITMPKFAQEKKEAKCINIECENE